MTRDLLVRGMLAGLFAALLAVLFARIVGEPQIDRAIGFEAAHTRAMGMAPEPEIVSRAVQKSLGLFTAVVIYGPAVGGVFSVIFAFLYGRVIAIGPRSLSLLLAGGALLSLALVPALMYPPNPPGVGSSATIDGRTATYFTLLACSVAALVLACRVGKAAARRWGVLNGSLVAAVTYAVFMVVVAAVLPNINEVPSGFPATVLWNFRVAALGIQVVLWASIGIAFGAPAERVLRKAAAIRGVSRR